MQFLESAAKPRCISIGHRPACQWRDEPEARPGLKCPLVTSGERVSGTDLPGRHQALPCQGKRAHRMPACPVQLFQPSKDLSLNARMCCCSESRCPQPHGSRPCLVSALPRRPAWAAVAWQPAPSFFQAAPPAFFLPLPAMAAGRGETGAPPLFFKPRAVADIPTPESNLLCLP